MAMLGFLILFPLVVAAVLLLIKNNQARNVIVSASAAIIAIASVALAVLYLGAGQVFFAFSSPIVDYVCSAVGVILAIVVLAYGIKYKNILASILAVVQVIASLVFEFGFAHDLHVEKGLYIDPLSILMALIIGVIGSGICFYALGYMKDHQVLHPEEEDRRPVFFALMFLFLAAMFGVVFSNNLTWLFTSWEVTTVCSFLLIGYTKTAEAIKNAFRQIIMNLLGGIAFVAALFYLAINFHVVSFVDLIQIGTTYPELVVFPITCLAFAGITKAAQMPFHSWLLGAMVAPTPTSALLHSSTMVKAGVFLLIKLAPILAISVVPSVMVILVGGITFALCSFMAISQTNAKRVLAYSTIANLGLIVACAGVGTPEAIWAATFMVLFHAVAKSLLFLCIGTAEHNIGSRDIEDMDLLFERMPQLTRFMMLGVMGMFIAPFGMLLAKWATLMSFIDTRQIALILLLVFGSAATFMFWGKWLGKLSGIATSPDNKEKKVHPSEWISIGAMAGIFVLCCALLPLISQFIVEPYILHTFGYLAVGISTETLWLAAIIILFLTIIIFAGLGRGKGKRVDIYLSGVSSNNADRTFINSFSKEVTATSRNWYMESIFGEKKIAPIGTFACSVVIIATLVISTILSLA